MELTSGVPAKKSLKHISALDGVRGLAVLMVIALHFGGGSSSSHVLVRLVGNVVHFGWSGVSLFFVLSGFLITGIIWDSRGEARWIRNFFARRMLRIFPLYYLALFLGLVVALVMRNFREVMGHLWVYLVYLQNVPGFSARVDNMPSPLVYGHFWSLAVEEQFYLLWPFLLSWMPGREAAKRLCAGVFVLSLGVRVATYAHVPQLDALASPGFLPARCGELAAGAFVALCYRGEMDWRVLRRYAPALFGGSLVAVVAIFWKSTLNTTSATNFSFGTAAVSILFASLLALALEAGAVARVMSLPALRVLGKYSYGLYVYHLLLIGVFVWVTDKLAPHATPTQRSLLTIVPMVVITGGVTLISYYFFEMPFLAARKRFRSGAARPLVSEAARADRQSETVG